MGQVLGQYPVQTEPTVVVEPKANHPEAISTQDDTQISSPTVQSPINSQTEELKSSAESPVSTSKDELVSSPVSNSISDSVQINNSSDTSIQSPLPNLDGWFQEFLLKLNSTPSEMYIISSDMILSCTFDLPTARAFVQQEAKKRLAEGFYRHKVESTNKRGKVIYSVTIYERNPNLLLGRCITVVQYNVWKIPILKTKTYSK